MDLKQNNFYFTNSTKLLLVAMACGLSACSLYESSGRKIIEKDTDNIVTKGFATELNAKYECLRANHAPDIWQDDSTSLNDYTNSENTEAQLTQVDEFPVVLVSLRNPQAAEFEGCSLQILDSKLSSQRLQDVVAFGEKLLNPRVEQR